MINYLKKRADRKLRLHCAELASRLGSAETQMMLSVDIYRFIKHGKIKQYRNGQDIAVPVEEILMK